MVQKFSVYALSLRDLFLPDCSGTRKKKEILTKKFRVNLFCTLTSLSGTGFPPGNTGFHSTNSAVPVLRAETGTGSCWGFTECAQVSRATSGSRTENSLRCKYSLRLQKHCCRAQQKQGDILKVLEIQKCHDNFSDSHPVYSQTRITDTTYSFFPSGATAMLCDFF